ncbi:MAG TPA: Clp protease ClpP [Candidatus Ligilactobacillus excrementipullorum]|nr:Clp protease ClpP [Candidatus Ligilactobacillus excrementipullorum]
MAKLPKYLTIKQKVKTEADLYIDGEIVTDEWYDSDTSAAGFRDGLKEIGDVATINLHVNSPGGSVFEGIAIYNMLKQNKATVNVYVDGLAASIASVIAMSGDTIFMPKNAMMMIHNPYMVALGNATELRKQADSLDQVTKSSVVTYLDKAGNKLDEEKLKELMDAETWLTAQESVNYGLADEILDANQAAASISPNIAEKYKNVPKQIIAATSKPTVDKKWREKEKRQAEQRLQLVKVDLDL